ncbi:MAG: dihydroorotate dehydrogenase electron transfer subunit [Lachnospiraceae bacterium]|nr:dihydroorotate dehydrogenase electron transfer subunit [Lachnospiraceae bacterium]
MAKFQEVGTVVSQNSLCDGIYDLVIRAQKIASEAKAGQFVSVYCKDASHLLPRPISLCDIDKNSGTVRLVYRVVGYGTDEFSRLASGDSIRLVGPLGNGYSLKNKRAFVIGGGIGIPPMLQTAKELLAGGMAKDDIQIVLGYRDYCFLKEEFERYGVVTVATEDGSAGTKGNVIDAIRACNLKADILYACGPTPMLRALKAYASDNDIEAYLSLEERMACGIGACLGCVCKSKDVDDHSHVNNKRVCADGPVFNAQDIEL